MTTKTNNLESLPTGSVVSGDTASSGDQLTLSRSGSATTEGTATAGELIYGNKSLKCVTASGESAYAYWAWTSVSAVGARCAFRLPSAPSVALDLLGFNQTPGGQKVLSIRLANDGKLYVKNYADASIYSTPSALTLPGIIQIDASIDPGVSTTDASATFAVYDSTGALTGGMSSAWEDTAFNGGTTGAINTVNFGKYVASAVAYTYEMDAFESTDAYGLVGPFVQGYDTPQTFGWHVVIGQ